MTIASSSITYLILFFAVIVLAIACIFIGYLFAKAQERRRIRKKLEEKPKHYILFSGDAINFKLPFTVSKLIQAEMLEIAAKKESLDERGHLTLTREDYMAAIEKLLPGSLIKKMVDADEIYEQASKKANENLDKLVSKFESEPQLATS